MEDAQKFAHYAQEALNRKFLMLSYRCSKCWHENIRCCCGVFPSVKFSDSISFIVYMDYKEVLNAGDDGKLLSCVCEDKTERIIYPTEDSLLLQTLQSRGGETIILFPSSSALSFEQFMAERSSRMSSTDCSSSASADSNALTIIVVDAVWRHARRMAIHLKEILPHIKHVCLAPETLSVYARTQSQQDRICTIEACALFLKQFGESDVMCDRLIECVRLNNRAIHGEVLMRTMGGAVAATAHDL